MRQLGPIVDAPKDGTVIWAVLPGGGGFRAKWDPEQERWASDFGQGVWKVLEPQPVYFDPSYPG